MAQTVPLWPFGDGEMAGRIREFDWATTPLGAITGWSPRLTLMVEMVLASPQISTLACGPGLTLVYNDAAARLYGDLHPGALGRPLSETFPAGWAVVSRFYEQAFEGEAVQIAAQPLDTRGEGPLGADVFDALLLPVRETDGHVAYVHMTGFEVGKRLLAEAALRESEARHRLLIESWVQAVWETDAEGLVVADSPSWRAYTGQTLGEWLGYGWLNAIHPDDRSYAERQWREAMAVHGLVDAEFRLRAPDGGWRWTNVRAAPVLYGAGHVEKWVGINLDIDVRKRAEAALRESEERYLGLYNALDQGFCTIKVAFDGEDNPTDYQFEEVSPAFEAQTGIKDAAGRWMRDIAPDHDQHWFDAYGRVALTGEPARFEAGSRPLGRWWSVYAYRIGDPEAPTVALLFSDITERKRTEVALRESEARLSQFGEASSDVLWMRDAATFQWTYLTPAFETIYGLDRASALSGDNMVGWADLIVPEDRERAVAELQRVTMGERVSFEYRIRRPTNGEIRWLRDTAFPMRDAFETVCWIGGVGRDITEEKETAEHMGVLVAELQHRTRNLMGVVRATADKTLRYSVDLLDFKARYGTRLAALSRVQGLLSRLAEGERITFDELIQTEVAALDGEGTRVVLQGPTGVALRSSTVQTFALAVHELATNAVKYGALAQSQAKLEIRWHVERVEPEQRPWLHVDWRERDVIMPTLVGSRRSGSGRELIERALPYQLGARTTYVMEADGVHCTIALPVSGRTISRRRADA